jgi:short-subunit dehydrogenase
VFLQIDPGTIAVITGAAGGIGAGVARALERRGVTLCLVDIDTQRLEAATSGVERATGYICDVSDLEAVTHLSARLAATFGRIDLLVNNAGISVAGALTGLPRAQFERAIDVNFWGTVNCTTAFLPLLRAARDSRRSAAICNVLSDFALFSLPTKAPYAASKHASRAYTECLSAELFGEGIQVTAVYPGATATGLVMRGYATDPVKQDREAHWLAGGMNPAFVGERIVRAIERGRIRALIGRDARAIDFATRLFPAFVQYLVARFWRRIPML